MSGSGTPPDRIHVKGLAVHAFHGVLPEEARLGQRFLIDLRIALDAGEAARADDERLTVSYADLVAIAVRIATGERFRLIETLAERIAQACLAEHPRVASITVRVEKPGAPVAAVFETVAVEVTRVRG